MAEQRPETEAELRQQLADVCRVLFRLHLVDYMGHPSVRLPGTEHVLIKPRHSLHVRAQHEIRPEDMAIIDLDGRHIAGEHAPPGERFIHTEIYRARPDVVSVVHTHQPMSTLVGIVSMPILPLLHVDSMVLDDAPVPIFACAELIVSPEQGRGVADALGPHRVCHLQGHGIVSVAASVQEATLGA
ncbi:MAG: class II aldolase/adducin family protein, partial [Mycobacteriaceae bacterium]|nr:class II aldolase/adducin family protein [Mycobacteriaceae bacterium]